ncbi:MAG: hypothetical protein J6A72_00200 [Alistipes sp.]|nr:hypothetical protein [Alistipes sp.]
MPRGYGCRQPIALNNGSPSVRLPSCRALTI